MRFSLEALDSGLDDLELQDPSPSVVRASIRLIDSTSAATAFDIEPVCTQLATTVLSRGSKQNCVKPTHSFDDFRISAHDVAVRISSARRNCSRKGRTKGPGEPVNCALPTSSRPLVQPPDLA